MNLAGSAGGYYAIANHLRHGIRARSHRFRIRIRERVVVLVFPTRLARRGVESGDDVFGTPAKCGVENAALFRNSGVAIAQWPAPEFLRTRRRPGVGQARSVNNKVAVFSTPHRPIL